MTEHRFDRWMSIVFGAFLGAVFGWIASISNDALASIGIDIPPFILLGFGFFLGFLLGILRCKLAHRSRENAERENKLASSEENERKEREQRAKRLSEKLSRLTDSEKDAIVSIYEKGHVETDEDGKNVLYKSGLYGLIDYDTHVGGIYTVYLADYVKGHIDKNGFPWGRKESCVP